METARLTDPVRLLIAKTAQEKQNWLPLWVHLLDTARVMERLFSQWLPPAARRTLCGGMAEGDAARLCRFVALTHDLGKATPAFQGKVACLVEGALSRLERAGFRMETLSDPQKTPHALAGEVLLVNAGCHKSVAVIVGAHHGRPTRASDMNEDIYADQLTLYSSNYFGHPASPAWERAQKELLRAALALCGYGAAEEVPAVSMAQQMLLSGLIVMADWIASNTAYFPLLSVDEPMADYDEARFQRAWDKLALSPCWQPEMRWDTAGLCEERFHFPPNALQQCVLDIAENARDFGLMVVEAHMGGGKTEAALLAAETLSMGLNGRAASGGVFFGLPTQATANGIFDRVKAWGDAQQAAPATIRLVHGAAELNEGFAALIRDSERAGAHPIPIEEDAPKGTSKNAFKDEDSPLAVHQWFLGRKQALLSDFVVGTIDQLLMAALKQKHVMLRHLGLCGKVVIIDECHAYDAYMSAYLDRALEWLGRYGTPVLLLSATLPAARRAALVNAYLKWAAPGRENCPLPEKTGYPLLTWTEGAKVYTRQVDGQGAPRTVSIVSLRHDGQGDRRTQAVLEALRARLAGGGCAGVIVNTVRTAQSLYRAVRDAMPGYGVLLAHAQFIMPDRMEKENEMMRRTGKHSFGAQRDRLIVIGTQVMEQSLDVDFDLLITELCPMDLLLQRIGRLHRHPSHDAGRPAALREAVCLVLDTQGAPDEGSAAVYGDYLLLRTRAFLPASAALPEDIPHLVEKVYDERTPMPDVPEGYQKAKDQHMKKQYEKKQGAEGFLLGAPGRNIIRGLLDSDLENSERKAVCQVRDGDPSLDVLVVARDKDHQVKIISGKQENTILPSNEEPDEQTCRAIAACKIRLPHMLCMPTVIDETIKELQEETSRVFKEWLHSPWLHGQLILLLNEDCTVHLSGRSFQYTKDMGLEECNNGAEGI